jgi:MIP family channel proteins
LIFVGAGAAAVGGDWVAIALAHGLVIVSIAYAYGPVSGAHLNPAVTLAVTLRGGLDWAAALLYWVAQLAGGTAAAALLFHLLGGSSSGLGATVPAANVGVWQAVVIEAVLTFFLANVVLHTTDKKNGTAFAGLAIGLTLVALILFGGPLTGAALNPARTFGPALFTGTLGYFWIYLIGPFLGAAGAAGVYGLLKK